MSHTDITEAAHILKRVTHRLIFSGRYALSSSAVHRPTISILIFLFCIWQKAVVSQDPKSAIIMVPCDPQVPSYALHCEDLLLGHDDRIWVATRESGLLVFDGFEFTGLQHVPSDSNSIPSNNVLSLAHAGNQAIWAGTMGGIVRIDQTTLEAHVLPTTEAIDGILQPSLYKGNVLLDQGDSILWIGTSSSLVCCDLRTYQCTSHAMRQRGPGYVNKNRIQSLALDPDNPSLLWVGSHYGLKSFESRSRRWTVYENPHKGHHVYPEVELYSVRDFDVDGHGAVWLSGYASGGLLRFTPANRSWKQIRNEPFDRDNPYFGNQMNRISRIGRDTIFFTNDLGLGYTINGIDTLVYVDPPQIGSWKDLGDILIDRNHVLWVSAQSGLYRSASPISGKASVLPNPFIKSVYIDDQIVAVDEALTVDADQAQIAIRFGVNNPAFPKKLMFKYQLKGYNQTEILSSSAMPIAYNLLRPGQYTFHYAVAYEPDQWKYGPALSITVASKLYQKTWFVLLIAAILAGTAGLVMWWINRRERTKLILRNQFERKAAEAQLMAMRAQMNPHFIFNSLNSIYNFIHQDDSENAAEYLALFSKLIRRVLQNSEERFIPLSEEKAVLQMYLDLECIRFQNKLEYEFAIDDRLNLDDVTIPPLLTQPHVENAIWHGIMHKKEKGRITIAFEDEGDTVAVVITDDGVGRSHARHLKQHQSATRKSLGNRLTNDRIETIKTLYNWDIKIDIEDLFDKENQPMGTRVVIHLPTKSPSI